MPTASETWLQLAPPAPAFASSQESSVFITYGAADHIWLINLFDALRNRDHRIFLDHPTTSDADRSAALDKSQAGLLVWSSEAGDAARMRAAFDRLTARAGRGPFPIVIARFDGKPLPDFAAGATVVDFPLYLAGPGGGEGLRLLLALSGLPATQSAQDFAAAQDTAARDFVTQTTEAGKNAERLQGLLSDGGPWETSSALGSAVAYRLVELARNDAAVQAIEKVSQRFPKAHRPRQVLALALARRGKPTDLSTAQDTLKVLYESRERDPETVGIYARTFMDDYSATGNAASLRKSRDLYAEAYQLTPDSYYNAINAAAKSVFLRTQEDLTIGRQYAAQVQASIGRAAVPGDYWQTATVAEAHLILGDYAAAATVYRQAFEMAADDTASRDTTWKQASRLMTVLQVDPAMRNQIRAALGNPIATPVLDVGEEIRFAIVMYGGVSLAIYINGVAMEFLRLVRATAADPKDQSQPLLSDTDLTGTERVYRRAAQLLGRERDDVKRAVIDDDPIRARFTVDILSGTSAGGINAIFLAKALANNQSMDGLKQLWIDEGAIEQLINDARSVNKLDGLPEEKPPTSLLNGRRMYRKLLDAFDGMDSKQASERSPFIDELDLFVTTTDIRGLPVNLRLADDVVEELRHRNVFRFRYSDGFSTNAANDFVRENNPFLAYAARCTSSFPFAFQPMKLTDIDGVLEHTPGREGDSGLGKNADKWRRFFPAYAEPRSGKKAAPAVYDFTDRAFGDGGYLDNKPFGHATDALRSRRGGVRSRRKLVFIEPSPEHLDLSSRPGDRPNVIENVGAALSLARYETIRDDLDRVRGRNRLVERVGRITGGMEEDVRVAQRVNTQIRPNFGNLDLSDMIALYGVAYGGYHRLKIAGLTDELAGLLSRISQYDDRSDEFVAIRYLVRAWRETRFVAYQSHIADPPTCKTAAPVRRETENAFLARYDLPYRLRRLEFVLAKIDQLSCIDQVTEDLFKQRNAGLIPRTPGERAAFRAELARLRGELRVIYEPLRRGRDALQTRGVTNPIAESVRDLEVHQTELLSVLKGATDHCRFQLACKLLADPARARALDSLATKLTEHIEHLTTPAAKKCAVLLAIPETVGQAATPLPAPPAGNVYTALATDFVRHYYESYERYDLISYPILQSSDIGEELDTVDVVRISPEDAPSLIDERTSARRKLAGTKLMHFGAFLDRGWRQNDILWGRMDGAERILATILPENEPERATLLEQAQLAILDEEYGNADRDRLCKLLVEGLVAQSSPDGTEAKLRALAETKLGSPINEALQAALRAKLDKHTLLGFFRDRNGYEVNPNLDPRRATESLARSTRVIGAMLEQLSEEYKVGASPSVWFSRLARAFWGLVEVAVPNTLANLVVTHWLSLLYLFEVLLIIGGILFTEAGIERFGILTLLVTGAVHVGLVTLGRLMQGKRPWSRLMLVIGAGAVLATLGVGIFALANGPTRAKVWSEIKAVFRPDSPAGA